jgi:hypothetical protein
VFEAVHAALEVIYFGRSVCEVKGLPNVDILFHRGIEKGGINVLLEKKRILPSLKTVIKDKALLKYY